MMTTFSMIYSSQVSVTKMSIILPFVLISDAGEGRGGGAEGPSTKNNANLGKSQS